MPVCIKLDKELSCEYICHQIQKLISDYLSSNTNKDILLHIDIKQITDAVEVVPKLEHKNNQVDN